jgi:solute carrier family 25 phosphate transporter 23/24/25/41
MRYFFRGNKANIIKVFPEGAVRAYLFDYLRDTYSYDRYNQTLLERFICGGIAAFLAETVSYPLEVAKTRMALSERKKYKGVLDCLKRSYTKGGVKAVYAGLSISQLSVFPLNGSFLMLNTWLRDIAADYH